MTHMILAATDWRPWVLFTPLIAVSVIASVLALLKAKAWRFAIAGMACSAFFVLLAIGNDHPTGDWDLILFGTGGAFFYWSMMVEWKWLWTRPPK